MGEDNDVSFHECEPFVQNNLQNLFVNGEGSI